MSPLVMAIELMRGPVFGQIGGDRYSGALFSASDCERFRFLLWRVWDPDLPVLVWCMLNPSTADALRDDATIRRCVTWPRPWGFGGVLIVNAYAFRSTDPRAMLAWPDRVGHGNDAVLRCAFDNARDWPLPDIAPTNLLVAWGDQIERSRSYDMSRLLRVSGAQAMCLGRTKAKHPRHPVRLPYTTPLEVFP